MAALVNAMTPAKGLKGCLERDKKQVALLGASRDALVKVFGEPSLAFSYHGKEVMHYGQPGLSFVEVVGGLVTRCEARPEQRSAFRVRPLRPTEVDIEGLCGNSGGTILDLSVFAMAVKTDRRNDFTVGERVTLRFSLPLGDAPPADFSLAAYYRMSFQLRGNKVKAVFLLDFHDKPSLRKILSDFISRREMEMLADYRESNRLCQNAVFD